MRPFNTPNLSLQDQLSLGVFLYQFLTSILPIINYLK